MSNIKKITETFLLNPAAFGLAHYHSKNNETTVLVNNQSIKMPDNQIPHLESVLLTADKPAPRRKPAEKKETPTPDAAAGAATTGAAAKPEGVKKPSRPRVKKDKPAAAPAPEAVADSD